jgi:hypothetical protein
MEVFTLRILLHHISRPQYVDRSFLTFIKVPLCLSCKLSINETQVNLGIIFFDK